jgi:ubiquinone/menaquinone biosynthesis C-methylase UbiE
MTGSLEVGRFRDVDTSGQAGRLLAFLDFAERLPQMPELRERSHELLAARPGDRVVDVGCGAGTATAQLAARGLTAVGVDASDQLVGVARSRHPGVEFITGTAQDLPLPDRSFQRYRAERVYQHLADPATALAEARRVLVPGGRIVLVDVDADLWTIDAADRATTRALSVAFADTITSPWIGRQYRRLLLDAGFVDVEIELRAITHTDYAAVAPMLQGIVAAGLAAGAVQREQADAWLADQRARGERGRCFVVTPMFLAAADVSR